MKALAADMRFRFVVVASSFTFVMFLTTQWV
jgi:hypothetical protein